MVEYGGVVYLYNDVYVKVFIFIEKSDSVGIGCIVIIGKYEVVLFKYIYFLCSE